MPEKNSIMERSSLSSWLWLWSLRLVEDDNDDDDSVVILSRPDFHFTSPPPHSTKGRIDGLLSVTGLSWVGWVTVFGGLGRCYTFYGRRCHLKSHQMDMDGDGDDYKLDLWTHMTRSELERNPKKHKAYPVCLYV